MKLPKLKMSRSTCITIILFLICWVTAFAVRTYHYNTSVYQLNTLIHDVPKAKQDPEPSFFKRFLPYRHKNFSPFTIESAMMFAYAQDIATGKEVPVRDNTLCGIEDIPPYGQMNMGLEWFLGWGWRLKNSIIPDPKAEKRDYLFQDHPYMQQFMSTQIRLWASLSSGLIFLWLLMMRCPKWLAFGGGFLHAVSLAAVARATGQDLVRGEFCIPLILMAFVTAYSIYTKPRIWKYVFLFAVTFLAFVAWDLCQMIFSAWAAVELVRLLLGHRMGLHRAGVWLSIAGAVLLNAAIVPFNVTYSLWRAPIVWVMFPSLAAGYILAWHYRKKTELFYSGKRFLLRFAAAVILPVILYAGWNVTVNTPQYASNYSHFSEAMKAKIKFRNQKPLNPSKLSYDARILWTPSMHSCTLQIANTFFPGLVIGRNLGFVPLQFVFGYLPVTLSFFMLLLIGSNLFSIPRKTAKRYCSVTLLPVLFTLGFIVGFIYIVRYHEFLIIFLSLSLPMLILQWIKAFRYSPDSVVPEEAYTKLYGKKWVSKTAKITLIAVFVFCLIHETWMSLGTMRRYTGDVAMRETAMLIAWFRSEGKDAVKGKGVAANITIGPMLKAYAGTGVVMNPQFGLKRIRDATEDYLMTLFHKPESELAKYCEKHKARYLVYHNGSMFNTGIYSNRYIANAKKIDPESAVNRMYHFKHDLQWFLPLNPPRKLSEVSRVYTVFQAVWPSERIKAECLAAKALLEQKTGNSASAKKLVLEAVTLDPVSAQPRTAFARIYGYFPEQNLRGPVL